MSEPRVIYNVQRTSITLESFRNRACGLGIEHSDFILPTPEEIKALRNLLGFSQVDLAKLTGVSFNAKGASAVRKWETTEGKEKRSISAAAWQLMLIKAGLIEIESIL